MLIPTKAGNHFFDESAPDSATGFQATALSNTAFLTDPIITHPTSVRVPLAVRVSGDIQNFAADTKRQAIAQEAG